MINKIKNKYYNYQPGEFLPIYVDGQLANRKQFHMYKLKWIASNHRAFTYQLTHTRGWPPLLVERFYILYRYVQLEHF